jgi:hypothetical protein
VLVQRDSLLRCRLHSNLLGLDLLDALLRLKAAGGKLKLALLLKSQNLKLVALVLPVLEHLQQFREPAGKE